jgi:hypothetical protein
VGGSRPSRGCGPMIGNGDASDLEATSPDIVQAAAQFLLYLKSVQHCSPAILSTYGLGLNSFARWLEARFAHLPAPCQHPGDDTLPALGPPVAGGGGREAGAAVPWDEGEAPVGQQVGGRHV